MPEFVGQFIVGISSRTSVLTRLNYLLDIRVYFTYLSERKLLNKPIYDITLKDIQGVTPYDLEKYLDGLSSYKLNGRKFSNGEKAKERKLASLRSLYKYLYKKELIDSNVTLKVDMPKIHEKPIIRLDSDEVEKMISLVESGDYLTDRQRSANYVTKIRDKAILFLFLGTGIRVSELVGLNKSDIDFEKGLFTVTRKGGNKSILYLPAQTVQALKEYISWLDQQLLENTELSQKLRNADKDILFYALQGKKCSRIGVRTVEKLVKKYAEYAAPLKKITPHKLRSTYATNLYRATEDIYVVADVLGHSDVNTTKRHYAQMSERNRMKAAEITKIIDDNKD